MDIGIGLPVLRPDPGLSIVDWARRAEVRGFSTLGCTDRLVYDNYEPLTALAVAAGATSRIRLTTGILLAPLRANHALFAKSAATLDRLSGGRLVLGLAPGAREDDYKAGRLDFQRRGKLFDSLLETATRQWQSHDGIGPRPATPGGPQLLFGGFTKTALRRMVTYGRGWIGGAQGWRTSAPSSRGQAGVAGCGQGGRAPPGRDRALRAGPGRRETPAQQSCELLHLGHLHPRKHRSGSGHARKCRPRGRCLWRGRL
ncbi:LLM class flavin-dependent oxidoreductase [Streptomyces chiangmaiensis]